MPATGASGGPFDVASPRDCASTSAPGARARLPPAPFGINVEAKRAEAQVACAHVVKVHLEEAEQP